MSREDVVTMCAVDLMNHPELLNKDPDKMLTTLSVLRLKELVQAVYQYKIAVEVLDKDDDRIKKRFEFLCQSMDRASDFLSVME